VDASGSTVKRSASKVALIAAAWLALSAHVGSPNVVFDGLAGTYPLRVIVRPPDVVPGLAEVIVRVSGTEVRRVTAQPVFWRTGSKGAPKGDEAKRVAGAPDVYSAQIWLMSRGAYSVYVTVEGGHGRGTVVVPVTAFATQRLGLSPGLATILIMLGGLLFAGLVTIVRAAAGESVLSPGATIDSAARRRANRIALIVTPAFALLVLGGARWWNAVDADYRRTMYRPPAADATTNDGRLVLRVHDTASFRAILTPVIPDHGKMMHLFLIEAGAHGRFGHFHPVQTDSLVFAETLAGWPPGTYRLFGDILLENGLSQTVATTIRWPGSGAAAHAEDPDDSRWPLCCGAAGVASLASVADVATPASLGDGYTMTWTGGNAALVAGRATDLRFEVRNARGRIAALVPYMGMPAHAVVLSADESVFVHLHPMGTVSTDAQQAFLARDRGDTTVAGRLRIASDSMSMRTQMDGRLAIPYEFPKAGRYRVWVQARPRGSAEVLTGAFDFDVH
jgi:hypothetical protein